MADNRVSADGMTGEVVSPGGFTFGVTGWTWGEPRVKSITFFLDGTASVCDQHGRPIRGTVVDGKEVKFAIRPPQMDDAPEVRAKLASHQQVVGALAAEKIDWTGLTVAGWPQLPYADLKKLKSLPPTPVEELQKIKSVKLRQDALRMRREYDEERAKEARESEDE